MRIDFSLSFAILPDDNMPKLRPAHYFFIIQLLFFVLVILGILPRAVMLYVTAFIAIVLMRQPLKEGVLFFVQSIPFFVALPFTESFDSFNAWRIILLLLFLKWAFEAGLRSLLISALDAIRQPGNFIKKHPYGAGGVLLLLLAFLSLINAPQVDAGIRRIIYFTNIAFIGIIVHDLVRRDKNFTRELIRAIRVPTMLVILAGFIQVASTYFIDIYQFMRLWGEGIQCNQFGGQWCEIAVRLGNTWFAYYGEQLSLRVFSLFPDSHSFPQFVLLGIPALLAYGVSNITSAPERLNRFKVLIMTRGKLAILWVPAAFLIAILSGTRGIWAASLGVIIMIIAINHLLVHFRASQTHKALFRYIASYLTLFFLLFSIAYPIFTSPQFLLSKGDFGLFRNRIKSIIDFGETSNRQRIEIWKKSVASIGRQPLLGVGIGNFPVVLDQDIFLARAGSSAHNIYLHIAAEMGIPALLAVLSLVSLFFIRTYKTYVLENDPFVMTYLAGAMLFIPWVLIYSLTDVALFDERAMLFLTATLALITGVDRYYE